MRLLFPVALLVGVLLCSCSEPAGPGDAALNEPGEGEAASSDTAEAAPLSTIVRILEFQGYTAIAEVESKDEHWEVEAFKDGERFKLNVDPVNGKILPVAAPSYRMPLSEVLTGLGKQGYGPVVKVDLEEREDEEPSQVWEIEIYKGGHAVFLTVDTSTGEILAEE